MKEIEQRVRRRLFELQDADYQVFQRKLIPNVHPDAVIGVRTPALRKLAKEAAKWPDVSEFLAALPHYYYEENNLHGFLIEQIRDYDACMAALDAFLPYVDNWATCDMTSPKVVARHLSELLPQIRHWMASEHTYTIRFGIGMLMRHYLDAEFRPEYLEWVAAVRSDEYYVKMMVAWYFATALAKQYEAALPYIEQQRLELWTHNKAIQKAIESDRITGGQKAYLRTKKLR